MPKKSALKLTITLALSKWYEGIAFTPKLDSFANKIAADETGSYVTTSVEGNLDLNSPIAFLEVGERIVFDKILTFEEVVISLPSFSFLY